MFGADFFRLTPNFCALFRSLSFLATFPPLSIVMPLLGTRVFHIKDAPLDCDPKETVFVIKHTNEHFQSKEEYRKRLSLYKTPVWTCQSTGQINLTHEDAWNSEKKVQLHLKYTFPSHYEQPTLERVHHCTDRLDVIVDKCWLFYHETFIINEPVQLKVKANGKQFSGKIVRIDTGAGSIPNGNCNSPSSDKENSGNSGNSHDKDESDSPSKKSWKPKLLPYTYSMKLSNEEKIVNGIPAADLQRVERPPSKETLRLYIRTKAIRYGITATSPWLVNEILVKKYQLPSKLDAITDVCEKMQKSTAFAVAEILKKRKADKDLSSPSAKKAKLSTSDKKNKSKDTKNKSEEKKKVKKDERKSPHKQSVLNFSTTKSPRSEADNFNENDAKNEKSSKKDKFSNKSPRKINKAKSPKRIDIDDDSSDDEVLANKMTKLQNGDNTSSPRKLFVTDSSSSDDDVILADVVKLTSAKLVKKSPVKGGAQTNNGTPAKKRGRPKQELKTKANVLLNRKGEEAKLKKVQRPETGSKEGKKVKQLTLFSSGVKKSVSPKSPKKSPQSSPMRPKSPPRTPRICQKIQKALTADDKSLAKKLTLQAARELSAKQIKNMPPGEIKTNIEQKVHFLQQRQKFKNMTPEQRAEYRKQKLKEMKLRARLINNEAKRRYEDQDLDGKPLPEPKTVNTPDGLPNACFGDVAMVAEFLSCYKDLLMPDEKQCPFTSEELMKALCSGRAGFDYLSRILVVLLQTLLQDQIAEDYRELRCPLSDIPVNAYTASEIVRLSLRRHDADAVKSSPAANGEKPLADDDVNRDDFDTPVELIKQLESSEFYELGAEQKLSILHSLCLRVLGTYSVQDYMEQRQRDLGSVWKLRINCLKEKNDDLKKKKEERRSGNSHEQSEQTVKQDGVDDNGPTLLTFMNKEKLADEPDLAATVKRRRQQAAKSAAQKMEREKEQKRLRQLEIEEHKKQAKLKQMEAKFDEVSNKARLALRQYPIGTDRNHDRYWVFSNSLPGLYVEKGWVTENVGHSPRKLGLGDGSSGESDDDSSNGGGWEGKDGDEQPKETKRENIEKTIPLPGDNQWFVYNTKYELEDLLSRLHKQGVRENELKTTVQKLMDQILSALGLSRCDTPGCRGTGNTNSFFKTHQSSANCPLATPSATHTDDTGSADNQKKEDENEKKEDKSDKKQLQTDDGDEMCHGFKRELSEIETRLRNGGLGCVRLFDEWEARLLSSDDLQTAASCLLETQAGIQERFLDGIMHLPKPKPTANDDVKEEVDADEPEAQIPRGVVAWREAVSHVTTWSRLHVLLGIMDSCVKWEKSAENAKCKICRKKNDVELLLCDECNQPFHLYCLRPALFSVPKGDWFCPSCKPISEKRRSRLPIRYDETCDGSGASDDEDDDKEDTCCVCGGDEGLITCSRCPSAYHLDCHDPPLRHTPRGKWECTPCKTGVRKRKSKGRAVKRPPPKKRQIESEDESGSETECEGESGDTDEDVRDVINGAMKNMPRPRGQALSAAAAVKRPGARVVGKGHPRRLRDSSSDEDEVSPRRRGDRARTGSGPKTLDPSVFTEITQRLYKHRSSWAFREPVDPGEVPDYYTIISQPITLLDIQERCYDEAYNSLDDYVNDVILLFNNAQEYNKCDSEVYQCMTILEKYFAELIQRFAPNYTYEREFVVFAKRR